MAPSLLSVVIPTRDTRDLTLRCVATVEAAGAAESFEIIVVDDASGDGTGEALARDHPRTEVLRLAEPTGFTCAANRGLARANGDLLVLLNSDTEVDPDGFAALRSAFGRDPRLGAGGAVLRYPDGSPQWSGGREPGLLWLFGLASGLPPLLARLPGWRRLKPAGAQPGAVDWVTGAALALRRDAWLQAGPFDEGYRFYAQDLDLCLRLRERGWKVELVPGWKVLHHHGATIGRAPGAQGGRQHPGFLWTDLLRWARRHRGDTWAGWAARVMRAGGWLRLLGRLLLSLFVPAKDRPAWNAESGAFRQAIRGVKLANPGPPL